jgi:hypothetical protein
MPEKWLIQYSNSPVMASEGWEKGKYSNHKQAWLWKKINPTVVSKAEIDDLSAFMENISLGQEYPASQELVDALERMGLTETAGGRRRRRRSTRRKRRTSTRRKRKRTAQKRRR